METNFSDVHRSDALESPVVNLEANPSTDGIHLTYAYMFDDHEGFLHGAPEFEVHVRKSAQQTDISCSGEQREATQFNFDAGTTWSGDVLVALPTDVVGDTIQYEMWEDDSGPCKKREWPTTQDR